MLKATLSTQDEIVGTGEVHRNHMGYYLRMTGYTKIVADLMWISDPAQSIGFIKIEDQLYEVEFYVAGTNFKKNEMITNDIAFRVLRSSAEFDAQWTKLEGSPARLC